jgi:MFS family permease
MTSASTLGPPFRRFWTATAAANLADGVRAGAFPLLALAVGGSPFEIALVAAAQQGAGFVFGLAAGSAADRFRPAAVVAAADAARVVVLGGLLGQLLLGPVTATLLAVAAFVLGVAEVFRDTAAVSVVPALVADPLLERANSRLTGAQIVGNEFAGPLLGASLVAVALALPVGVDASLLLVALVLVTSLARTPAPARPVAPAARSGWAGGITWLRAHPRMLAVTAAGAAVLAADAAWWSVLVVVGVDVLGLPAAGFGALLAAGAAGGLLGALVAERIARSVPPGVLLPAAAVGTGLPAALVPLGGPAALVGLLVVSSAAFALWNVAAVTLRQREVPPDVLGRVSAAHRLVLAGAGTAGALAGGALAEAHGATAPFLGAATLTVVAGGGLAVALRR